MKVRMLVPDVRAVRPARVIRMVGLGLLAFMFVMLLPVAPAQQRDLGTIRNAGAEGEIITQASAAAAMKQSLPYRPFLDPVRGPVHSHWYLLLLPMSFGVAVVYKAVALQTMDRYWSQVVFMTVQIVVGMIVLAIGSYAVVMVYVPWIGK